MSTPVNQLPIVNSAAPLPDDPELMNVLSEMEKEVAAATAAQAKPALAATPPMVAQMPTVHVAPAPHSAAPPLWDQRHAQNAALAAVIALVLFHPTILRTGYSKLPAVVADMIARHDSVILRTALFAVVIYAILWKFKL